MTGSQTSVGRVLRDLAAIDEAEEAWRALEAASSDPLTFFQTFDWCREWIAQFATETGADPFVYALWQNGTMVALWPLMTVNAAGIKRIETLGVPHTQYCGMLVRDDVRGRLDLRAILRDVTAQSGCDVAVLRAVPADTELARLVGGMAIVPGSENVASMLDLSAYDSAADYTARLGKLQKRNRNRRRNHLARLGELDFEVIWPDHPQFSELVRECTAMKRVWLKETGRYSAGFSMQGYEDFLAGLPGEASAGSGACLSVLRAGDKVVAMELGFIRHRHYYAYVGGFDWSLRHLSPGKVQMDMTVCWLIDNGVKAYDLLINPADYKASWSSHSVAVASHAQPLTWKGRLYASTWLPTVRPALKQLRTRLPEMMHTAMTFLRGATCLLLYV